MRLLLSLGLLFCLNCPLLAGDKEELAGYWKIEKWSTLMPLRANGGFFYFDKNGNGHLNAQGMRIPLNLNLHSKFKPKRVTGIIHDPRGRRPLYGVYKFVGKNKLMVNLSFFLQPRGFNLTAGGVFFTCQRVKAVRRRPRRIIIYPSCGRR